MNLIDFVSNINEIDEDLIISLKDMNDFKSDMILSYPEEDDTGVKIENSMSYHYLLEVFLAKEFVSDWVESLDHLPSNEDIAKRLYEYGINNA
ncbi:hypothetical protein D1632_10690 [Chryseobacterium nematophagum]|uniref:Uncharacterized protein n=1 Tax=Chryseobacterium nematophagum TaxID=2305228 RepID=A0A3M7LDI0_9FLAO|nr:hypothetical protein [Chryseobacterium nematophagum]RMZ60050.1 hypothetical protein D1632_10690 [Chryseobacterium nematophagum]